MGWEVVRGQEEIDMQKPLRATAEGGCSWSAPGQNCQTHTPFTLDLTASINLIPIRQARQRAEFGIGTTRTRAFAVAAHQVSTPFLYISHPISGFIRLTDAVGAH